MKVLILAGGFGTRLSEDTVNKPKPMVEIGGKPILWHIMKSYSHYGYNEFVILLGYKGYIIKEYFANYFLHQSDVTIDLKNNKMEIHSNTSESWKVTLLHTGDNSMTGGRVLRAKDFVGNEPFMMTYGDGLSNVSIKKLIKFHYKNKSKVTLTAVRPKERYGILKINNNRITYFDNQNKKTSTYINGGYFVIDKHSIKKISNSKTYFEQGPLNYFAKKRKLLAFKHEGFWKSLDTLKDKNDFNNLYKNKKKSPWTI